MTTQTAPTDAAPPRRFFLTLVHLAALGLLGSITLSVLFGVFSAGLATAIVGVGLVLLAGVVYALFGVAWFEIARVDGLYGFGLTRLRWQRQQRPGFGAYVRALVRQAVDPNTWRAVANFAIATLLGAVVLQLLNLIASSVFFLFAGVGVDSLRGPFGWRMPAPLAPVIGALTILLAVAAIIGIVALHRALSQALVADPHRRAQLAALAQASAEQRSGAVRAADVERTRIERDLHDGVQPRLVSLGMTLGLAQQKLEDDPAAARALIEEAHTSTKAAITELRQLARGIHTSVLDDRGLDAALSALAGRSHIPVHLDVRVDGRCSRDAEAALYFAIAESLTNAAKHSRANACRVVVRSRPDGTLWARMEDDGIGGARVLPGGGLDGITNRILAAGGSSRLDSPVGGPTSLEVSVPCAS